MSADANRVTVLTRAMWRIRLGRELPRYLLSALSLLGLAASVRMTIAPPRPSKVAASARGPIGIDRSAEAYAVLFARRYLTWNATATSEGAQLQSFTGPGIETNVGLQPPPSGAETVEWAEVVQAREPASGQHVYTVAAQTDTAGLLYLSVGVTRASGGLDLSGYPAFVGPPATVRAHTSDRLHAVDEPALEVVVRRGLTNYLANSPTELAADLAPGARVSPPRTGLSLEDMGKLSWAAGPGSVLAQVQARDRRGALYTLDYEVDVARAQGRWEISAVQMDPNT